MLDYEKDIIIIRGDYGDGLISIEIWDREDKDWVAYFVCYSQLFVSGQTSFWDIVADRIKFAWFAIRGKKYQLFDILVTREDLEKLRDELNHLLETE